MRREVGLLDSAGLPRRAEHPGVLGAAALAGVDHQLALGQRDPGQPAGQHPDLVAVVDRERPQVDVPRRDPAADQRRAGGQRRSAAARSSRAGRPRTLTASSASVFSSACGPMTMPLPPEPSTGLSTSWSSDSSTYSTASGVVQPVGLDVRQHRLLVEVVADQVGHVGVEQLVVGDAVADRVGDGDLAGPGGVEHAGAADHRVGPEVHRVEELVVDPAVDDVDRAARRPSSAC